MTPVPESLISLSDLEDTRRARGTLTYIQVSVYTCDINLKSYFRIFSADFNFAILLLLLCNPSLTLSGIILVLVISLDSLLSPLLLDFCPPCCLIVSKKSCNSLITDFSCFSPLHVHTEFHCFLKGEATLVTRTDSCSSPHLHGAHVCSHRWQFLMTPFDWSLLPPCPQGETVPARLVAEDLIFFCGCGLPAVVGSGRDVCMLVVLYRLVGLGYSCSKWSRKANYQHSAWGT